MDINQFIIYIIAGLALALSMIFHSCISQTTLDLFYNKKTISKLKTIMKSIQNFIDILFPTIGIIIIILFFMIIELSLSKLSNYFGLKIIIYGVLYPIHLLIASFIIYSFLFGR